MTTDPSLSLETFSQQPRAAAVLSLPCSECNSELSPVSAIQPLKIYSLSSIYQISGAQDPLFCIPLQSPLG